MPIMPSFPIRFHPQHYHHHNHNHNNHSRRLTLFLYFCAGLSSLLLARFQVNAEDQSEEDDSFTGSFLLDIFDTLTSTANAKDCPGLCIHVIATTICYEVLEEVECPSSSMICCLDKPLGNDSLQALGPNSTSTIKTEIAISTERDNDRTTLSATPPPIKNVETYEKTTSSSDPINNNNKNESYTCLCTPENLSDYCEAIIPNETQCAPNSRCCVDLRENMPANVIIPNVHLKNKTQQQSTPETKTTAIRSTTTEMTRTTPKIPSTSFNKTCKGDCVGGIIALYCYNIDWEAQCEEGSTCCLESFWDYSSSPSTKIYKTTSTTTVRTTTISNINNGPKCPGTCYLSIMAAFCVRPSILIPKTSCARGRICCDNRRSATTPSRPKSTYYKTTTMTSLTTSNLTPVTTYDPRLECPGSCIVPYLSFTCFRNAEMTDIFKCKKPGHKCCAPKSTIREVLDNIDKNDSLDDYKTTTISTSSSAFTTPAYTTSEITAITFPTYSKTTASNWKSPSYSKYVCGVKGNSRSKRVVGGEDGEQGEWCWQVALINSLNQYLCGAALIGTQWVLTAAHCVTNIVRAGDAIYVRVGDHDLTKKYGSPGAQTLRVATTYIHHNHNSQTLDNDIALLKLHGQAELKEGVCLVCLPARGVSHAAGKRCTVTGYGYMGEAGPIPLRVREAEIPIVSDTECRRKVNAVTEKIFILPASSFCAGGEEGNDACQGDGGGPLVCQDDGFYELVGLVSWGFGCGRLDVPGVYVKVSSFIGWINQIISVNNL